MAPPASPQTLTHQTSHSPSSSPTSSPNNVAFPRRLQLQRSISSSTISTSPPTWTPAQESRLLHCQTELHSAQKRWSASQELWIEEKKYLKAVKKLGLERDRDVRAKKVVGIWKGRTWKTKSRVGSGNVTPVTVTEPVTRAGSEDETEDEDEDEDEDDDGGEGKMSPIRRRSEGVTVDLPPPPSPTTSFRRPSIGITLRKLSVPGIRRRSTAPVGAEAFGGRGE
ncbi:hypothetical protein JMJ35_002813 [Cladonia borealis]|uniref:Uncharacterized protein n=1 Tax=Cladonia borealis TaxID=184061 RepID=A0AA39UC79_9LECA|nr:hypothetical protein JMJ35_002813 [Cladonia borealis]